MAELFFDFLQLFDADEYLYFMEDSLRAENTGAQVDFIETRLGLQSGCRIVDLGCGHGRHSIELARRGHDVTGVDLVEGFLELARKEAQMQGVKATFLRGDIGTFMVAEPEFHAALCMFDAFGFFDDAHCIGTLRCVHKALLIGGKLVLDIRTREWMVRVPACSVTDKGNGDLMIDRHQFDIETGRFIDRRTYVRDGKQREVMFSVRLYAYTEIKLILHSIGFEIDGVYGDFDGSPLSPNKSRTIIIARKVEAPTESTA